MLQVLDDDAMHAQPWACGNGLRHENETMGIGQQRKIHGVTDGFECSDDTTEMLRLIEGSSDDLNGVDIYLGLNCFYH